MLLLLVARDPAELTTQTNIDNFHTVGSLFSPHLTKSIDAGNCYECLYVARSVRPSVCLSVRVLIGLTTENHLTDREPVWGVDSCGPKGWGTFWRHKANTVERSVFGDDAGCRFHCCTCSNLLF